MDGKATLTFFISKLPDFLGKSFGEEYLEGMGECDIIIPHQPSGVALTALKTLFSWNVVRIIDYTGNMMATSVPLGIYTAIKDGRLKRGQKAMICGLGAGATFGGFIMEY